MPATEWFGYVVTSVGSLTTTFTPAPACATTSANLAIGDALRPPLALFQAECRVSHDPDCIPSASELNDIHSSFVAGDIDGQAILPYYSPASICPSGWQTVGVASAASDSVSRSGVFTAEDRPLTSEAPGVVAMPPHAIYMESLEEGEEIIWCCPSGHSADFYGHCFSSIPPWDPEEYSEFPTVCNFGRIQEVAATVTSYDGRTWDPPLPSISAPVSSDWVTAHETLTPGDMETPYGEYTVWSYATAIALVHGGSGENGDAGGDEDNDNGDDDGEGDSDNADSDDENEDSENGEDENGNDEGAAPSTRALKLLPFSIVGLGFLAGMGVIAL